jgi:hypothetical protein
VKPRKVKIGKIKASKAKRKRTEKRKTYKENSIWHPTPRAGITNLKTLLQILFLG